MRKKLFKKLVVTGAVIGVLSTGMTAFAAETYTVQEGDYLKKIAQQIYGDAEMWGELYQANQASIANPNVIYKGQVLTLPGTDAPVQGTDETTPTGAAEAEAPETEAPAPETETAAPEADVPAQDSTAVKNVPVGVNPEVKTVYDGIAVSYRYTMRDGSTTIGALTNDYVSTECEDAYGIRYVGPECEKIMQYINDFIVQNPGSNLASLLSAFGGQFVFVSADFQVEYESPDYGASTPEWAWDWVDCEPNDCVYVFLDVRAMFNGGYEYTSEELWAMLVDSLSSSLAAN